MRTVFPDAAFTFDICEAWISPLIVSQALQESTLSPQFAAKALAVWFGILVLAIANGAFREAVLIPVLGNAPGLVLSGVFLSLLIFTVAYFSLPWFGPAPAATYVILGLSWLCLTLVFEFTFGYLIQGKTWSELLDAYTFKGGNIWPLVLLVVAATPYIAARIRGWA